MDFFNKAPTQVDPSYEEFKALYSKWYSLKGKNDPVSFVNLGKQMLKMLEEVDYKSYNAQIIAECSKGSNGLIHPVFNGINSKHNVLNSIVLDIINELEPESKKVEVVNAFTEMVNKIPFVDIYTYNSELERNKVSDMPEAKFANVTRSFNRNALPAYVSVDLETTGLAGGKDRIVQISAARVEDTYITDIFATYINPGRDIPEEASEINGITDEMVKDAPTLAQISDSFLEYVGKLPIIGYNTMFDLKFLFCNGLDFLSQRRKLFDVMDIAKKVFKAENIYTPSFSLVDVAGAMGVYFPAHNAIMDCIATHFVFQKLLDVYLE